MDDLTKLLVEIFGQPPRKPAVLSLSPQAMRPEENVRPPERCTWSQADTLQQQALLSEVSSPHGA